MTTPDTAPPNWTSKGHTYAQLMEAARGSVAADGGFIDPAKWRAYKSLRRAPDWYVAVLGHARRHTDLDLHALLIADRLDLDPPLPAWLAERRAAEATARADADAARAALRERLDEEWTRLREALPVPAGCYYNYSGPNHVEGFEQGAVHIVLAADLTAGRLTRARGDALCTTPSTRRHQHFALDGGQDAATRRPTCKACITTACRLTGATASTLLAHTRGRGR